MIFAYSNGSNDWSSWIDPLLVQLQVGFVRFLVKHQPSRWLASRGSMKSRASSRGLSNRKRERPLLFGSQWKCNWVMNMTKSQWRVISVIGMLSLLRCFCFLIAGLPWKADNARNKRIKVALHFIFIFKKLLHCTRTKPYYSGLQALLVAFLLHDIFFLYFWSESVGPSN